MAGLAVGYGQPDRDQVERMLARISHRGPVRHGVDERGRVVLAQNYAKAEIGAASHPGRLPYGSLACDGPSICFDGQIGDWATLASASGVTDGPFREERLLLKLFRDQGCEMLHQLSDAIFAFVISDGQQLLAARDLLGIKTLFYGRQNGTLYLASELKALQVITDDVHEFPPGHFMDDRGVLKPFAELSTVPRTINAPPEEIVEVIRDILWRSTCNRIDFSVPTAGLLSGGLDSSVICCLASRRYREEFGPAARLKTFAMGIGESQDIRNARRVAEHIRSEHHELIVDLDELLRVLPEVIYHLESFDASLVRSAAANYLISRRARECEIDQLLSGEGGDEVFCGYTYLKEFGPAELTARQLECLGLLHSNASLRLDRMNQCHGVRVVTPLISGELLEYALRIPPQYKMKPESDGKIEKWIFRKAYEADLPVAVVWRGKQEFSQGSGSADALPGHFEEAISDEEFAEDQARYSFVRSKEELHYFRVFAKHFGTGSAVDTVGQWVCI